MFTTVPPDCAVSRGNLFDLNKSSSWNDVGTYGINQNGVGLEANLGYDVRAQFGLEHLGIGLNGPTLDNQTVAGIAAPKPFYLYVTVIPFLHGSKVHGADLLLPPAGYSDSTTSRSTLAHWVIRQCLRFSQHSKIKTRSQA